MSKKREHVRRKEDIRIIKRRWSERILIFSGFALLVFFLLNLAFQKTIEIIPYADEIILALLTVLAISFLIEGFLRLKMGTIYEIFYSSYIAFILIILSFIYWLSYLNSIEIGIFRTLIVLTHLIVFFYSLLTVRHSNKIGFIIAAYILSVLITIILFAYIYWTLSIFNLGYLQFSECSGLNLELQSENWFYFSAGTFYALGYGDICPVLTPARLFSQLEVAMGTLINTILIGFIFWKIREINIEEAIKKRKSKTRT